KCWRTTSHGTCKHCARECEENLRIEIPDLRFQIFDFSNSNTESGASPLAVSPPPSPIGFPFCFNSPTRFPIMLRHQLIHPKINEVLARAGHHAKVLIADGNYPASSTLGPHAELVSLNLSPGIVNCTQVLAALVTAIPIEA